MADEHKIDHDPDNLENLSPEELQEHIQEEKKNAKRSLRFAFTALIAIIAVCIAWFAANNQVTMTGTQISAENDQPFEIASVGERQNAEKDYLKDDEEANILSDGVKKSYASYIDTETWERKNAPQTYYVGNSGLAWHMNAEDGLVPGSNGKLEFYFIAKKDNLSSVNIKMNLSGYVIGTDKHAVRANDTRLQNLISGHILLFQHMNDITGYSGWLGENGENTLTITAKSVVSGQDNTQTESATFEKNVPYKITLYWVWPQYFRNYIYTQKSTEGDLFTDRSDKSDNSDYNKIAKFVNEQRTFSTSKLFYKSTTSAEASISSEIKVADMTDELLDECSEYYNKADEYIGTKAQYIYVEMEVS